MKVCGEVCGTIDMLPTFAKLAGGKVPTDRVIDGRDIWALMSGKPRAKLGSYIRLSVWGGGRVEQ